MLSSI